MEVGVPVPEVEQPVTHNLSHSPPHLGGQGEGGGGVVGGVKRRSSWLSVTHGMCGCVKMFFSAQNKKIDGVSNRAVN